MSLLRETRLVNGKLDISGRIAYVPQEPWIFPGTVRENILFGSAYDKKKYHEVIRVCSLSKVLFSYPVLVFLLFSRSSRLINVPPTP